MLFALLAAASAFAVEPVTAVASPSSSPPASAPSCLNTSSFALLELAAAGGAALASPGTGESEQPSLAWAGPDPRDVPCSGNKPCIFDAEAAASGAATGKVGAAAASPVPQCPPGSIPFRSNVSATTINGRQERRAVLACYICGTAGAYCDGQDAGGQGSGASTSSSSSSAAAVAQRACPAGSFCPRTYVALVSHTIASLRSSSTLAALRTLQHRCLPSDRAPVCIIGMSS